MEDNRESSFLLEKFNINLELLNASSKFSSEILLENFVGVILIDILKEHKNIK